MTRCAFDHADGDELGETGCTRIGALRTDPVDNMGDRVGSDLDPAVILAQGLEPIDLAGRCCFEVTFDVGMQRRLVVLHGQKIVGLGVENALGNVRIASHGVDRDQGALEIDAIEKGRNSGDFVRFFIDRLLPQDELAGSGEGGYQMQSLLAGLAIMAAARGLAVDGNEIGLVWPAFGDPRRKAGREQVRINSRRFSRLAPVPPRGAWRGTAFSQQSSE
jgi:hypothetical protein